MAEGSSNGTAKHAASPNVQQVNGTTEHPPAVQDEKTDLRRWRLRDDRGRQTWHYLETDEEVDLWPQSTADKYFLDLPLVGTPALVVV